MPRLLPIAVLTACAAFAASADEVFFKSGDKLTGTVKTVADGKMTFDSAVAGVITLKLEDIKTFVTASETEFVLKSGTYRKATVPQACAEPGSVLLDDGVKVALADIQTLNPPPKEEVKWTGKVSAGASLVRGNTHTSAANLSFETHRRSEHLRLNASGAYYFEKTKNISTRKETTTSDNWFLKGQADWFFTEKNYVFFGSKYERDRIALLDRRYTPTVGYGYQWIERDDLNFSTEAGLSYTDEEYDDDDESENHFLSGRLSYHVDRTLWSKVRLYHNLEFLPNFRYGSHYYVNADAGLQAPIYDKLNFEAKIDWKYNAEPADDRYKSDTRYIAGLSWLF